uniref:Uncharacterized protein n=1 Tax=Buteo japonicus TaxID=224669 RepID=A0A8C0AV96_9AVES
MGGRKGDKPRLCFVKICFCHEWRNLLYLRDNKENRTLFFPYKNHNYQQEAEKSCIYIKKFGELEEICVFTDTSSFNGSLPSTCPDSL